MGVLNGDQHLAWDRFLAFHGLFHKQRIVSIRYTTISNLKPPELMRNPDKDNLK